MAKYGFDSELNFIPYSTRAAWCTKYPNAVPYVECVDVMVNSSMEDGGGGGVVVSTVVRGYPLWNPNANSVTDIPREVVEAAGYHGANSSGMISEDDNNLEIAASMAAAAAAAEGGGEDDGTIKKRPRDDKLLPRGILGNAQRLELHSEIYNYFVWLRTQVKTEGGKGRKSVGGMSSDGLKELLKSMGDALPSAKSGHTTTTTTGAAAAGQNNNNNNKPPPFLEEALFAKLKHRVDSGTGSTSSSAKRQKKAAGGGGGGGSKKVRKEKGPVVSWDDRLKQLTEFGDEHGHFDLPPPLDDDDDDDARFYNWVQKINYELRGEVLGEQLQLFFLPHVCIISSSLPPVLTHTGLSPHFLFTHTPHLQTQPTTMATPPNLPKNEPINSPQSTLKPTTPNHAVVLASNRSSPMHPGRNAFSKW